ncbi:hypothetical protein [Candidatus Laterigemmans baculatus]|uniref:hypothetical protein n=1 Tax=Candidatus Laterigemmans baculatus TaxID=2770505 RepID=UPI0013DCD71F|nr:hypothetical protein [Candidatus Laterigemmans baculatus]
MAKRSAGGPNKSAAIRQYLDSNPEAKPREIVDALKEQGLEVTPAFVSTIKSKSSGGGTSAPKKRRGRPKAAAQGAAKTTSPRTASAPATKRGAAAAGGDTVSVDGLIRAKKLAEELGGVDKVRAALAALEKITG